MMVWPYVLVVGLPLAWFPCRQMFVWPKLVVLVVALLLAWAAPVRRREADALDWCVGLGLGWVVVSWAFAAHYALAWWGWPNDHATGVGAMLLYAAVYCAVRSAWKLDAERVLRAFGYAGAVAGLVAGVQYAACAWGHWCYYVQDGRPAGPLGGPPYLGMVLAMALPCAWGSRAAVAAIVLGLLLSRSAGAWAAALCAMIVLLWGRIGWREFAGGAMALAFGAYLFALRAAPSMSARGRLEAWQVAIVMVRAHPLVGVGPAQYQAVAVSQGPGHVHRHAHNDVLEVAATSGLPAACAYVAAWALLLWRALRAPDGWQRAAGASLIAWCVAAKFAPVAIEAGALGAMMAALVAQAESPPI